MLMLDIFCHSLLKYVYDLFLNVFILYRGNANFNYSVFIFRFSCGPSACSFPRRFFFILIEGFWVMKPSRRADERLDVRETSFP